MREPSLVATILPSLSESDCDVRQAAAEALGLMRTQTAIESLVLALTDEERGVRQAAEASLEKLNAEWTSSEAARRASSQLHKLLEQRPPWVKSAVAQLFEKLQFSP